MDLSGNDIGCWNSSNINMDTAAMISMLINLFQTLRIINLSDCKLNFSYDNDNNRDESSFKKFFNSIKSKNNLTSF